MLKILLSILGVFGGLGAFMWTRNASKSPHITDIQRERYKLYRNVAIGITAISSILLVYFLVSSRRFRYKMETSSGRIVASSHQDIAEDINRRECDTKKRFLVDLVKKRDTCFAESGRVSDIDYPLSYDKTYMRDYSVSDLDCDRLDADVFPNMARDLKSCQMTSDDPCTVKVKKATSPLLDSINALKSENDTLIRELVSTQGALARLSPSHKSERYSPTVFDEYDFDE